MKRVCPNCHGKSGKVIVIRPNVTLMCDCRHCFKPPWFDAVGWAKFFVRWLSWPSVAKFEYDLIHNEITESRGDRTCPECGGPIPTNNPNCPCKGPEAV